MKNKLFFLLFGIIFIFKVFGNYNGEKLYYYDENNNGKIDVLQIDFGEEIYGNLSLDKIFLYSNTGGLSSNIIQGNNIFSGFEINKNILKINLIEQDLYNTGLLINNTTKSHLRLRTNTLNGIFYKNNNSEIKLSYTTSFNNYKNAFLGKIDDLESEPEVPGTEEDPIISEPEVPGIEEDPIISEPEVPGIEEDPIISEPEVPGIEEDPIISEPEVPGTEQDPIISEPELPGTEEDPIINEPELPGTEEDPIIDTNLPVNNIDFKLIFQNPSYLVKNKNIDDEFLCDNKYTECRVNLNVEMYFESNFKEFDKKFKCIWDFQDNDYENINKCNPNTIVLKNTENIVKLNILDSNNSIIYSKILKISKAILNQQNSNEDTQTGSSKQNSENNYNINFSFQNPSDILEKDKNKEIYYCDNKNDCRVNLIFNNLEGNNILNLDEGKINCKIKIKSNNYNDEKTSCNPPSILLGFGENILDFEILEKISNKIIYKKTIKIIKNSITSYRGGNSTSTNSNILNLDIPNIKVQSGLDENNFCLKDNCGVNLTYENKDRNILCEWDFGDMEFKIDDKYKCNPGIIKTLGEKHRIYLKIYQKDNPLNYKTNYIDIKKLNILKDEKKTKITEIKILEQEEKNINISYYDLISIGSVLPNPSGKDLYEFIEVTNNSNSDIDLKGCEIYEKNSNKKYKFKSILKSNSSEKFYNFETKISLNNTKGFILELNCFNKNIDNFVWNLKSFDDMILDKNILDLNILEVSNKGNNIFYKYKDGEIFYPKYILNPILDIKSKDIDNENKKELVIDIINNTFTQKVSKTNNGLKIYGKTIPKLKLVFYLEKEESYFSFISKANANNEVYRTNSDQFGNYSLVLSGINTGNYKVNSYVEVNKNNTIEIEKQSFLEVKNNDIISKETIFDNTNFGILLQTKPSKNNEISDKKIICKIGECSVNFTSNIKNKDYKYYWDFGDGTKFEGLNPSGKKFIVGKYIVELLILGDNFEKKDYFLVEVLSKKSNKTKKTNTNFEILLQTKPSKNNEILDKKIICKIGECSVNFASNINNKNYKYYWDFGDGTKFEGSNPSSKKFTTGTYKVELKVLSKGFEKKDYFIVEVVKNIPENNSINKGLENNYLLTNSKNSINKDLILTLLIFFNFLLLSFIILKSKKII